MYVGAHRQSFDGTLKLMKRLKRRKKMKNERKKARCKRSIDRLILIDKLKRKRKDTLLSAPSSIEERELDTCINRIQSNKKKKRAKQTVNLLEKNIKKQNTLFFLFSSYSSSSWDTAVAICLAFDAISFGHS